MANETWAYVQRVVWWMLQRTTATVAVSAAWWLHAHECEAWGWFLVFGGFALVSDKISFSLNAPAKVDEELEGLSDDDQDT